MLGCTGELAGVWCAIEVLALIVSENFKIFATNILKLFQASLSILTITPLTLTLPFALSAYLFVAHTLGAPGYAPVAALFAGGVTALVGMFCVGLVEDT